VPSYAGVDTVRISCFTQFKSGPGFYYPHELFIGAIKEHQAKLREGKATTGTTEILGELVSVNRAGSTKGDDGKKGPYYPYVITWRGIRFELQACPEAIKTTPNVIVYIPSMPLTAKGGDWTAVWDEARYFLENVLLGQITQTKVGRLDIFADLPGQTMFEYLRLFNAGAFVRRSRLAELKGVTEQLEASLVQGIAESCRQELEFRIIAKGARPQGLYLGGAGILCRIYDKLKEMEDKEDLTKFEAMKAAYWGGGIPKELCRVEFQMNSRQLREAGITDVESLRRELPNVAGWLCNSWLTVREEGVDHRQSKRAALHPMWAELVGAVASRFGGQWNRSARVLPASADKEQLRAQAVGCLTSLLAQGDFPGDEGEMIDQVLDAVLVGLNKNGVTTTFERLKAKVLDHHARSLSAFSDLSRHGPSAAVDFPERAGRVLFADYSHAPGGVDGVGDGARSLPDARLAMFAVGDDPVSHSAEQWERWQRAYRWPSAASDGEAPAN